MASAVYPKYKEVLMSSGTNTDLTSGTVKAALVTASYNSSHQFYSDISAAVIGTPQTIGGTRTVTNGTFKTTTSSSTWSSVTGSAVQRVALYIDTGTAGTSRLVASLDSDALTGLPVTPNGGNITANWDTTNGIFTL